MPAYHSASGSSAEDLLSYSRTLSALRKLAISTLSIHSLTSTRIAGLPTS